MNNALVTINETTGVPTTTSKMVAEVFGKLHHNILRDIESLECSKEFRELNFEGSSYAVPGQRRSYPMYHITRDGFTFLAMGFTGAKAAAFKEQYIAAFNAMEKQLSAPQVAPKTPAQVVLMLAQMLVEQEQRITQLELKVSQSAVEAAPVQLPLLETPARIMRDTVTSFGAALGVQLSGDDSRALGKMATTATRKAGIPAKSKTDSTGNTVGYYPKAILREVFAKRGHL
ncbi:MAG: Rha family transcriptional regulator [Geobacter sp.]|nr:MAG: Rha family transcriptional regulator [Geobacter sp.]